MDIENNKEEIPFGYYEELFQKANAEEMADRCGAKWDGEKFYVNLLGTEYAISHPNYEIAPGCPLPVQTFLLRFLLEGKNTSWGGTFKTFREMPWGELYIKPYTGRVLTRVAFTFGTRVAAFKAACEKMGAKLYLPPLKLCGDNGAMIGAQGYYEYLAGHVAQMDLNAYATRDIAE